MKQSSLPQVFDPLDICPLPGKIVAVCADLSASLSQEVVCIQDYCNLSATLQKRSYFLFGPRASDTTTLIKRLLPAAKRYDVLNATTYWRLMRDATLIEQETRADELVVIDDIQKLPMILDEVHRLLKNEDNAFF